MTLEGEVFAMTVQIDDRGPFLRRFYPYQIFVYRGERWAVAESAHGIWVTHVDTGFGLIKPTHTQTQDEVIAHAKAFLDGVSEERFLSVLANAREQRKVAEERGLLEEKGDGKGS